MPAPRINKEGISYIKNNWNLLERKNIEEFYAKMPEVDPMAKSMSSKVTPILLNSGINPLEYLSEVPTGFLNLGSSSVNTIEIPDRIKVIGSRAFNMSCIDEIKLPSQLEYIGASAFAHTRIEYIEIPETVQIIKSSAFYGCKRLKTVVFRPKSLAKLQYRVFWDCPVLENVYIHRDIASDTMKMKYLFNTDVTINILP